jgi:hypothetical protein
LVTALDAINGFSALGVFFEEGPIEAIIALHGGGAWADGSWGGLGWFVAAALILLHIRKNGGES